MKCDDDDDEWKGVDQGEGKINFRVVIWSAHGPLTDQTCDATGCNLQILNRWEDYKTWRRGWLPILFAELIQSYIYKWTAYSIREMKQLTNLTHSREGWVRIFTFEFKSALLLIVRSFFLNFSVVYKTAIPSLRRFTTITRNRVLSIDVELRKSANSFLSRSTHDAPILWNTMIPSVNSSVPIPVISDCSERTSPDYVDFPQHRKIRFSRVFTGWLHLEVDCRLYFVSRRVVMFANATSARQTLLSDEQHISSQKHEFNSSLFEKKDYSIECVSRQNSSLWL